MSDSSEIEDPLKRAREDFVEKISVAGWKEAVTEPVPTVRYMYRLVLLSVSIACVFLVTQGLIRWRRSGFTDEITDFYSVASIPMANISVCAQVYLNQTFVKEMAPPSAIPPWILAEIADNPHNANNNPEFDTLEEFYRQMTLYLSSITRPRAFSERFKYLVKRLYEANADKFSNYADLIARGYAACEKMFKRCWLDGEEFDCCTKAVRSLDDDGICYVFMLNSDSDNAIPQRNTFRQSRPGPEGGFVVEASLPLDDFPWLENDAQNGFRVVVGHVPFGITASPVLAPDSSETFVIVKPEYHALATECARAGNMSMPGGEYMYYDPEGMSCIMRDFQNMIAKYAQCRLNAFFYYAEDNMVCDPIVTFMMIDAFTSPGDVLTSSSFTGYVSKTDQIELDIRAALSDSARCPNHCHRWTYSSTASFFYLDNTRGPNRTTMQSKIHVYYADMNYREHAQVEAIPTYLAFCDFGNVIGLYWGMSIVSIFHVVYYVAAYLRAKRKWGVRKDRVEDIREMT